jgi:hypothetical protein
MYNIYLKYLRYRIRYCNTPNDILKLLNNINFFYKNISSDGICNILIECLILYPLSNEELQKFSMFQQQYDIEGGIYNFVTFTIWICIIMSIQETDNKNKIKNNIKNIKFDNEDNNEDNNINDELINNYIILPGYIWGVSIVINKKIINKLYNLLIANN